MSHPPPSFNADHYNQGRWHDGNIDQGRPANPPAPFWSVSATNIPHNQPDAAYYRHHGGGPGAWPGSTLIVDNALVWPSGHPGQQAYASHPHIKDGHGVHNAQYRVRFYHFSSADIENLIKVSILTSFRIMTIVIICTTQLPK